MTANTTAAVKGGRIIYNDGRPGHCAAGAEIIEVSDRYMVVQFDDRMSNTTIYFSDRDWMDYIRFV